MDFAKQDGTPSVKLHHAPGGKSNFSLAWDAEPLQNVGQAKKQAVVPQSNNQQVNKNVQSFFLIIFIFFFLGIQF